MVQLSEARAGGRIEIGEEGEGSVSGLVVLVPQKMIEQRWNMDHFLHVLLCATSCARVGSQFNL